MGYGIEPFCACMSDRCMSFHKITRPHEFVEISSIDTGVLLDLCSDDVSNASKKHMLAELEGLPPGCEFDYLSEKKTFGVVRSTKPEQWKCSFLCSHHTQDHEQRRQKKSSLCTFVHTLFTKQGAVDGMWNCAILCMHAETCPCPYTQKKNALTRTCPNL